MEEVKESHSVEIGGHTPLHGEIVLFPASALETKLPAVQSPEGVRITELSQKLRGMAIEGAQETVAVQGEVIQAAAEPIPTVGALPRSTNPAQSASWLAVFQKRVADKLAFARGQRPRGKFNLSFGFSS